MMLGDRELLKDRKFLTGRWDGYPESHYTKLNYIQRK